MAQSKSDNPKLTTQDLPRVDPLPFEPLSKEYSKIVSILLLLPWLVLTLSAALIVTLINAPFHPFLEWGYYAVLIVGSGAFIALAKRVAQSRGYVLRKKDIHYKSGVLWHKTRSLPFSRIQHMEIESGPLARHYDVTTLKFYTAGGGSADMQIPALDTTTAHNIRAYIIGKTDIDADEADNDHGA